MAPVRGRLTIWVIAVAYVASSFLSARVAEAACSTSPPASPTFYGDRGQVDSPFVVPGDHAGGGTWVRNGGRVKLTLATCPPAPPSDDFDRDRNVVALVFTPPSGGARNALLLAADCRGVDVNACTAQLGAGGQARCASTTLMVTEGAGQKGRGIFFDVPPPNSVGLPDLAGPATIVVTTKVAPGCALGGAIPNCKAASQQASPPLFCVDDLYQASCSTASDPVFPNFTVLPELNDFQALCRDNNERPKCAGGASSLRFAIDKLGNALIPIKWTGVLRGRGNPNAPCPASTDDDACGRRKFVGYTGIDAFPDRPGPIRLSEGVAVKSFNMRGGEFVNVPITASLTSDAMELRLEGEAHKPKGVLRLPSGGSPHEFFDFRSRMSGSVGPIELRLTGGPGVCQDNGVEQPSAGRVRCDRDDTCGGGGRVCAGVRTFAKQQLQSP